MDYQVPPLDKALAGKGLPSYTSSPLSDYLESHIYELLGIPAHETRLGYRDGKIACACRAFTYPGLMLFEFSKRSDSLFERRMDNDAAEEQDAFGANVSAYLTVDEKGVARHIHPFAYKRSTVNADLAGAIRRIAPRIDMNVTRALFDEILVKAYSRHIPTETTKETQLRLLERRYREGLLPLV